MSEKIIFEEKDNGAWLPRNRSPTRLVSASPLDFWVGGDLLLTEENFIFKGREKKYDITLPLKNSSVTMEYPFFDTPIIYLKSVNGEVLAQFKSKKLEEWKMAIEKQTSKVTKRRVIREKQQQTDIAKERERALDYDSAIIIWEKVGKPEEAARVRKLKAEQGSVKVDQTVVHGDYVDDRDTIIKDSVINRSNVGGGGDDKFTRLEKLTEMKEKGLISDEEYEKMKLEIIG